jgi:hypothetical protein
MIREEFLKAQKLSDELLKVTREDRELGFQRYCEAYLQTPQYNALSPQEKRDSFEIWRREAEGLEI